MAVVPREEHRTWVKGMTAPYLEVQYTEDDGVTPIPLYGYAVWDEFWMVDGTEPHKVAPNLVTDPLNGVAALALTGEETPTPGRMVYVLSAMCAGSTDSSVEEWGTGTQGPFKVLVLDSAP